jgi:hypothetical protein
MKRTLNHDGKAEMKRAARTLSFVAMLTAIAFTSQAAHAAFLFVGIKRLNLAPGSPNDCLTIALATMRDQGFANLRRGNDVSGSRAGAFVSASCAPAPGDNSFWVFVAPVGDDENATRAGVDVVTSNL